ncbi:MAG TPA: 3D domain-containing protein [Pyrinomonadaceae bacterium]|jgi:3D (Asp-Asp-Asp) domain-containing protein|nr:3D domain-containing protein [Pyrinomonadaceae bacterium]
MKSFFGGSAFFAASFVTSCILLSALPSVAETPSSQKQASVQQPKQDPSALAVVLDETSVAPKAAPMGVVIEATDLAGTVADETGSKAVPTGPILNYTATAYSLYGKTASGRRVSKGLIAADPHVLPLGTRVRLDAGAYSGEYLVADTGGSVRGKRIDIWTPSSREAMRFGRRAVKLTVLTYPARPATRKHRAR